MSAHEDWDTLERFSHTPPDVNVIISPPENGRQITRRPHARPLRRWGDSGRRGIPRRGHVPSAEPIPSEMSLFSVAATV